MAATTSTFTLVVQPTVPPLKITSPTALPPAVQGVPYSYTFVAEGGVPPYKWTSGDLSNASAASLMLTEAGVLSGTPSISGTVVFQAEVKDAAP